MNIPRYRMRGLASREGRCATGASVPATEYGLRDGVDNIGELAPPEVVSIPLRRMRMLTSLRLQANLFKGATYGPAKKESKGAPL